ncbi:MAG TPA: HlyD family efflux transporter periplasmic adaptor subunit [Saprospiraceae bacterium]|nr:HlyD family efflux transporter periplasmic adaptor subunit [Saprospiraceae bacterium]HMP23104.1 HlyD family efflux transporter periplasmic adaptor subunit [Saprospiraceae bacterium]
MKNKLIISLLFIITQSCNNNSRQFDATGTFEADEVIISAEAGGKIMHFDVTEGMTLQAGQAVGAIDCSQLDLQRQQAQASLNALQQKTNSAAPQTLIYEQQIAAQRSNIGVLQQQLSVQQREQQRIQNLVKADAVPAKQLDDINGAIDVLRQQIAAAESQITVLQKQIKAQQEAIAIQNRGILSESDPMQVRVTQFDDQLSRCTITNPLTGTVLTKYAEANEMTAPGKALYKIADLRTLTLRAYITGNQLPTTKLNQTVRVLLDDGKHGYRELSGIITWISDKSEFTPKTIQTKEERQNLVYAMKVKVNNDGYVKIGMYGEVLFQ